MIPKKITRQFLEKQIQNVEYVFDESGDNKWVLCVLTIANGFKVEGVTHRQFTMEHNKNIAKSSAYQIAFENLWGYYTFLAHYKYHVEIDNKETSNEEIPMFVRIGNKFHLSLEEREIKDSSNIHVLALVDGFSLAFINIKNGVRWRDPVRLKKSQIGENINYNDIWVDLIGRGTYWEEL